MKPKLYKLQRFKHEVPQPCPYCLLNASLGYTQHSTLGCQFCQGEVDKAITERFEVIT